MSIETLMEKKRSEAGLTFSQPDRSYVSVVAGQLSSVSLMADDAAHLYTPFPICL